MWKKLFMRRRTSLSIVVAPFPIVVWPSFVAQFQLPWLCRSNYDRKKIQSSIRCYAIPITTGKKRYSHLAIIRCAVPIAIVAPFQLRLEKKKIQSSVHCYAIPIMTGKKRYGRLVIICCAIPIAIVAPFQL